MAKETFTRLIDDVDGGKADETVKFGLDGQTFEIDLSTKNAKKLRTELGTYVARAVKVKTGPTNGKPRPRLNVDNNAIREWAQAKGYEVAPRGRISQEVVDAYHSK